MSTVDLHAVIESAEFIHAVDAVAAMLNRTGKQVDRLNATSRAPLERERRER